jgi:hypothetical protein
MKKLLSTLILIACLSLTARAQAPEQPRPGKLFWSSIAARAAAAAMDSASSQGKRERNPMFRNSEGRFSAGKHAAINLGTMTASILIARKYPRAARVLTFINFSFAGMQAGVAARNFGIHKAR